MIILSSHVLSYLPRRVAFLAHYTIDIGALDISVSEEVVDDGSVSPSTAPDELSPQQIEGIAKLCYAMLSPLTMISDQQKAAVLAAQVSE